VDLGAKLSVVDLEAEFGVIDPDAELALQLSPFPFSLLSFSFPLFLSFLTPDASRRQRRYRHRAPHPCPGRLAPAGRPTALA